MTTQSLAPRTYEPTKQLAAFHIRGFQYWDGALVLNQLKTGDSLSLVQEPDNPHDPEAVAIYAEQGKLGYIPADRNSMIATMLFFGHADIFETRILQVDPEANPWEQVRIAIYIKDAR